MRILGFAVGVALALVTLPAARAQAPCPDVQTAMSLAGVGVEMQVGAVNARRQSGLMAGEDAAFDVVYTALNEAGVHVHYLISIYQILPQIARGPGRDALSTSIIPAAARDIGSSLALADQVLPRVRNPEARAMLQRGVEVRRALGREFERCRVQ